MNTVKVICSCSPTGAHSDKFRVEIIFSEYAGNNNKIVKCDNCGVLHQRWNNTDTIVSWRP